MDKIIGYHRPLSIGIDFEVASGDNGFVYLLKDARIDLSSPEDLIRSMNECYVPEEAYNFLTTIPFANYVGRVGSEKSILVFDIVGVIDDVWEKWTNEHHYSHNSAEGYVFYEEEASASAPQSSKRRQR